MICPACGSENRTGARFCDVCGAALALEPERDQRKIVTVLFCDVTGSTAVACSELVRARLASLDGRHDDAVAAAKHAADLGDAGYFLMRPWFTTEHGRALAAAGRDDEARQVLAEASRLAHVKGSTLLAQRAEAVLP